MLYPASPDRLARLRGRALGRRRQRGFSLIELIVVVIIISVLAVLAIPSITARMKDRRTQQAAQEVMNLYRAARMRAMGRGSAVLVRFDGGRMELREAVRGTSGTANCAPLPVATCLQPLWQGGSGDNTLLNEFEPAKRAEFDGVQIQLTGGANYMDVCFTPMGRAFVRGDSAGLWTPLTDVRTAEVWRKGTDNAQVGLTRQVLILPNGHARLGVSRLP